MEREQISIIVRVSVAAIITLILMITEPSKYAVLFYLIPYLTVGCDVIFKSMSGVISGELFDEHFLMTAASLGAIIIGEYPEAVAVMLFYQIGEFFQDYAVDKSKKSVAELMELKVETVKVKRGERVEEIRTEEVKIGDEIIISPGEKSALDGVIVSGCGAFDTKSLTGEGMPRTLDVGDAVLGGYISLDCAVTVKVTKEYPDSTVAKIAELVEKASERKASTERFITKFSRIYTPVVTVLAVIIALAPIVYGLTVNGQADLSRIRDGVAFLVVSCPCALVISVPLAYFGGIGAASKKGILIKGSDAIENLSGVKIVALDKTGTVTKGNFAVTEVNTENGFDRAEAVRLAAIAEKSSNHPIAKAIVKSAAGEIPIADGITEYAGEGIIALYNRDSIAVGNRLLMNRVGAECNCGDGTTVSVAKNGKLICSITVSDEIKPTSKEAINQIKQIGIEKTVMLTGDRKETAKAVAENCSIDEYKAELLPTDKVACVEELSKNAPVAFVGDGINDAPVIKAANVGIAMGAIGSDAAIEAADVVIMNDNLMCIVDAVGISKRTKRTVKENVILSLAVKFGVMIIGVIGIGGNWLLWAAVFADVGVSLLAVLNSLRLLVTNH